MYVENAAYIDSNTYYFNGNNLISSLSNSPNWNNVKNDYAIWGVKKSISGAELPVHFRYAIHKKPKSYKSISLSEKEAQDLINIYPARYGNMKVDKLKQSSVLYTANDYDWRELIYQMALDYFKYGSMDNFHSKIIQSNPEEYPTGITGYESFYTDIQGFWR